MSQKQVLVDIEELRRLADKVQQTRNNLVAFINEQDLNDDSEPFDNGTDGYKAVSDLSEVSAELSGFIRHLDRPDISTVVDTLLENPNPILKESRWENGHCPTFALALHLALAELGYQTDLMIGYRTVEYLQGYCDECEESCEPCTAEDVESEETIFSHVVVVSGDQSFDYDSFGAIDGWEDKFKYNSPDNEHSEFEWVAVTVEELAEHCSKCDTTFNQVEAESIKNILLEQRHALAI